MPITQTLRYIADEIQANADDPYWWRQRFQHRVVGPTQRHIYTDGIDMETKDWDTLCILDACRADLFEDRIDIDQGDTYQRVRSNASATPEWIERTFGGKSLGDTVYVSANPWVTKKAPDAFHAVKNLWLDEYDLIREDLQTAEGLADVGINFGATIGAEKVTEAALSAHKKYPNKRIIAHYFQPHAPYVGWPNGSRKSDPSDIHPGRPLAAGEVTHEDVWDEYGDNLEYGWTHAHQLANKVDGKTVITSDHGELFGEFLFPFPIRGYAHPLGLRDPDVTTVPWIEFDGDRRRITDDGTSSERVDDSTVNERLRSLGYKE